MNNIPNCILEAKGWTSEQTEGKIHLNNHVMELAGDKLESMTVLNCSSCELYQDCKPKPLFEQGKFTGVRIEI